MTTQSFTLSRTYPVPRHLAWRAWTDPSLTARWWHPRDVEVAPGSVSIDLREGGHYTYTMTLDGEHWPISGTYLEVREPERLRFTWRGPEDADDSAPRATVELRETEPGTTEMVFTLERSVPVESAEAEDVEDGWRSAFDDVLAPLLEDLA